MLEIPVTSNNDLNSENNQKNSENNNLNFQNSKKSVKNPASTNPNTEVVNAQTPDGSKAATKSMIDIISQIKSGQVQQYGGENGFIEIHLRGARAFDPAFYFNGLPLTSAVSGGQNLNLLPSSAIGSMNIYPDNAPFWLGSMGIGGDIDIISCTKKSCFDDINLENNNRFKASTTIGSYGFKKIALTHALTLTPQTQTFEALEYTKSLEDYPVFNNNNSTLHAEDGTYENLQNNDFKNFTTAVSGSHFYAPLGKLNLNLAFGTRDQGVPSTVGTISTTRLKQNLLVGTLKLEKFFPTNGIQWTNQIGGLFNKSQITSGISTFSNQGSLSNSATFQAKSTLIIPSEIILNEQTGVSFELLNSNTEAQTFFITNPNQTATQTNSNRLEYKPSFFEGFIHKVNDNLKISSGANIWISEAQDTTKISCNSDLVSSCHEKSSTQNNTPTYGYTFSLQSEMYFLIPYLRYSLTQRRPYLMELYGSPGGILPNNILLNEQSKKEEFGIQLPYGDTGVFHADDKNLIFLQQASPVTSQYVNLQSGYRNGYFLNLNYELFRHWETYFHYQYLNSIMTQDGQNLVVPRSPKHTATLATNLKNVPLMELFQQNIHFSSFANAQYESPFYID
ncbi:MAG: TonB-dependent receptor plug domain-containing protein, partial [Bdellovibrionota bacterium]